MLEVLFGFASRQRRLDQAEGQTSDYQKVDENVEGSDYDAACADVEILRHMGEVFTAICPCTSSGRI